MKKSIAILLLTAPLVFGLTGCVIAIDGDKHDSDLDMSNSHDRAISNRQHIAGLIPGLSFTEVTGRMGTADFNESYDKSGETIQVLFYRTHRVHKDDLTTKDECTPLIFKQGGLVSWGDNALRQL